MRRNCQTPTSDAIKNRISKVAPIVFDEKTIADRATYENPEVFAEGVKYVIVNGKVAIDGGKYSGAMAGRALRKSTQHLDR